MKGGVVALVAVLAIIISMANAQTGQEGSVTCGQVDAALLPCVIYLTGRGGDPSPACCAGVRAVKAFGQTTADRRASCACVKAAANRYSDLDERAAQSLPSKCNVQLDIPVSRNVNCDAIV